MFRSVYILLIFLYLVIILGLTNYIIAQEIIVEGNRATFSNPVDPVDEISANFEGFFKNVTAKIKDGKYEEAIKYLEQSKDELILDLIVPSHLAQAIKDIKSHKFEHAKDLIINATNILRQYYNLSSSITEGIKSQADTDLNISLSELDNLTKKLVETRPRIMNLVPDFSDSVTSGQELSQNIISPSITVSPPRSASPSITTSPRSASPSITTSPTTSGSTSSPPFIPNTDTTTISRPPEPLNNFFSVKKNQPTVIFLQAFDPDDSFVDFNIETAPTTGRLSNEEITSDGLTLQITYTPNFDFIGQDVFTFSATDPNGVKSTYDGIITITVEE